MNGPDACWRVLMIAACPFPVPRGTPVRILRLAEALVRRGHEVHVATYHLGEARAPVNGSPAPSGEAALPFPVHRTRPVHGYRRLDAGPTLTKLCILDPLLVQRSLSLCRALRFDLVHAHHYEGLLVGLRVRGATGLPVVYDAHTLLSSELPFYGLGLPRSFKRALGGLLDSTLPRRAEHVVSVSEAIGARLEQEGVPASRLTVVPNGVECDHFARAGQASNSLSRPVLAFAGNLAPYQGIELLLRAFAVVLRARPDCTLRVLLEPGLRERHTRSSSLGAYEPLAAELRVRARVEVKLVRFERLPEELGEASVALNPRAACDGVPQKLLNYMAAGRPIASFASSGRCLRDGVTALVVPDGDVTGLAAAAERLLDDRTLARRLGDAARDDALSNHAWPRAAERLERVYETVCGSRGRSDGAHG